MAIPLRHCQLVLFIADVAHQLDPRSFCEERGPGKILNKCR